MELPPEAIKDAEGVGRYSQVWISCALFRRLCSFTPGNSISGFLCLGLSRSEWCESLFAFVCFVSFNAALFWWLCAVELGIADPTSDTWRDETAQRVLLKKGDSFFVPPGNVYRYQNRNVPIFWLENSVDIGVFYSDWRTILGADPVQYSGPLLSLWKQEQSMK